MLSQLRMRSNGREIVVNMIYPLRPRVIEWRPARCLTPCDKLSSPLSAMLLQLIRGNESSNSCCCSLPAKVKSDSVKSYKMFEAL